MARGTHLMMESSILQELVHAITVVLFNVGVLAHYTTELVVGSDKGAHCVRYMSANA